MSHSQIRGTSQAYDPYLEMEMTEMLDNNYDGDHSLH